MSRSCAEAGMHSLLRWGVMNINQLSRSCVLIITLAATAVAVCSAFAGQAQFMWPAGIAAIGITLSLWTLGIASRESPVQATLLMLVDAYPSF